MFEQLTTAQKLGVAIVVVAVIGLLILLFAGAWHVTRIARGPVAVGPDPTLEAARRWQASAAGVRPWYLPQPQQRSDPEPEPREEPQPEPVPEEETRPAQVAKVPDDMSAVDAEFAQHFRNLRTPPAVPTQKVSTIGWPNNPHAPAVPFPVEIDRQNRELRERLDDPDRTELIPPVPSRRGAA
ncbi:hypothetical protein GCM10011608_09230 [Micromonospora sonchi]|uniref:Uncharacterized protein n=2 Tax=Micromonospora sonchi TaxID=1763543 RepID=A0A917TLM7_9ACTN|nr:hypothetical protein GCM10011608_09230 [Micromonospora sonchi]